MTKWWVQILRCEVFPYFLEGYAYLVFLDVNHELAFEPINSIERDAWYQTVKNRAESLAAAN